ncbi:DNA-binding Lrp family transcriptional regulator [Methanohalophilus levihalophilus]|uniref:helix-turn-helix transcriptional regulator n=1 Tax=Methanohalophilus levihalophilus TaxID=1431282 RepID=UPI001AE9C691|nr:Lrp/AsnC family transcriptional regulator [Methanohalophilus levihalophilus]MBP2029384.1 DNA-binding Lrp family transcriptional regulator [Methanohalophilus levihalophilus]
MGIEEDTLDLIKKNKEGIYQNVLWKELEIDSRKCSRIVTKLEKDGKITREKATANGSNTYLIKATSTDEKTFELLLSGDMFSPCTGCRLACQPESCEALTEWILNLDAEKQGEDAKS